MVALLVMPQLAAALSVDEAVQEALARNPRVALAAAEVDAAIAARRSSKALLPSDVVIYGVGESNVLSGGGEFGTHAGARARVNIGGQRGLGIDAASADVRAAEARLTQARIDVAADARRAFAGAWRATRRAELGRALTGVASELAASAKKRLSAGDLSPLETNVAVVDAARSHARLATALGEERKERARLGNALGRATMVNDALAEPPITRPVSEPVTPDHRFDLAALGDDVEAAKFRETLGKRAWVPTPEFNVSIGKEQAAFDGADFVGDPSIIAGIGGLQDLDWVLGVAIELQLPAPSRSAGAYEAGAAKLRVAEASLALGRLEARREITEALAALEGAHASVLELDAVRRQAQENVELAQRGFSAGELSIVLYLATRNEAFAAAVDLVDARAELLIADADLRRAIGEVP